MAPSNDLKTYKLMSVNTNPERAKRMIAKLIADISEQYQVVHCANAERIEDVSGLVSTYEPDIMFCASMWTPEQSAEIKKIAREIVPGLRCYAVPQGMQIEKGPEYTTAHVKSKIPEIIEGDLGLL